MRYSRTELRLARLDKAGGDTPPLCLCTCHPLRPEGLPTPPPTAELRAKAFPGLHHLTIRKECLAL